MPILHEIWNHLALLRDPTAIALLVAAVSVPVSVGLAWRSWRARRAGEESAPPAKDLDAIIAGLKERGLIPDGARRHDTVRLKLDDIMRGQDELRRRVDAAILHGHEVDATVEERRRDAAREALAAAAAAHGAALRAAEEAGLQDEEIERISDVAASGDVPAVEEVAPEMSAALRGPVPPPYPRPAGCALERDACAPHPVTCGAQHTGFTCTRPPHSAGDHCAGRMESGVPTVAFRWGHGG